MADQLPFTGWFGCSSKLVWHTAMHAVLHGLPRVRHPTPVEIGSAKTTARELSRNTAAASRHLVLSNANCIHNATPQWRGQPSVLDDQGVLLRRAAGVYLLRGLSAAGTHWGSPYDTDPTDALACTGPMTLKLARRTVQRCTGRQTTGSHRQGLDGARMS